jgi:hypothetical protein
VPKRRTGKAKRLIGRKRKIIYLLPADVVKFTNTMGYEDPANAFRFDPPEEGYGSTISGQHISNEINI